MDSPATDPHNEESAGTITPVQPSEEKGTLVELNVIDPVPLEACFHDKTTPTVGSQSLPLPLPTSTSAFDNDSQTSPQPEAEPDSHAEKVTKSSTNDSRPTTPSSLLTTLNLSIPDRITMPTVTTSLGDMALHSPSSQIIGTPFATNSTRFEYPFPEPNSDPSSSSTSPLTSTHVSPTGSSISHPPIPSGSSFPMLSTSPSIPAGPPPPIAYPIPGESGSPPSYSPIHPRLKNVIPPMPPSLIKKRPKWSLGLLGRRRSSQGSQSSGGDSQDTTTSIDSLLGGTLKSPPLATSREEREPNGPK